MPSKLSSFEEPGIIKCSLRWVRFLYEENRMGGVESLEKVFCIGAEISRLLNIVLEQPLPKNISLSKALAAEASLTSQTHSPLIGSITNFSKSKQVQITSISPNHDTISKNLFYLRNTENIPLKNITATDIANGNTGSIVKLIWALFSKFVIHNINTSEALKRSSPKEILVDYLKCLEEYTKVKNIRSIQDGITICAMAVYFSPGIIDFSKLVRENKAKNLHIGYHALINQLNVPQILDLSDLNDVKTSERSIIFFTAMCISYLEKTQQSSKQANTRAKEIDFKHIKSKTQLMEQKIEELELTAQKLTTGVALVITSNVTAEKNEEDASLRREIELENHIINLELKVGRLLALVLEQNEEVERLQKKQKVIENIINFDPEPEETLTEEELRIKYSILIEQNKLLSSKPYVNEEKEKEKEKESMQLDVANTFIETKLKRSQLISPRRDESNKEKIKELAKESSTINRVKKEPKRGSKIKKAGTLRKRTGTLGFLDFSKKKAALDNAPDKPPALPVRHARSSSVVPSRSDDNLAKKSQRKSTVSIVVEDKPDTDIKGKKKPSDLMFSTDRSDAEIKRKKKIDGSVFTIEKPKRSKSSSNIHRLRANTVKTSSGIPSKREGVSLKREEKIEERNPKPETWDILDNLIDEFE